MEKDVEIPLLKQWRMKLVQQNCEWCNTSITELDPPGSYSRKEINRLGKQHLRENPDCLEKQLAYDKEDA